jgi:predicted RNA-binding Zn-ribbon protein involved in translation (DUF1610 family)
MNREQRRAAAKQAKKNGGAELEKKIASFGSLPDFCLTCEKPFDKNNKEMVMSWNVVVHDKEEAVRLYCPECWEKALEIAEEFRKHLEEKFGEIEE